MLKAIGYIALMTMVVLGSISYLQDYPDQKLQAAMIFIAGIIASTMAYLRGSQHDEDR